MEINSQLDKDKTIEVELIENSVEWHKEENGDNILLQYINGGETMRVVERFSKDAEIKEAHHWGKSLAVKFADGHSQSYHQDKFGNYRKLNELEGDSRRHNQNNEMNGQKEKSSQKAKSQGKMSAFDVSRFAGYQR